MTECQVCLEYREETGNPTSVCGYCECDQRNKDRQYIAKGLTTEIACRGVSLQTEEWETIIDRLQIFPKQKGNGWECVELSRKIEEQLKHST